MSDELRLYFFECGSLKTQVQFIKMNQGLGDRYEIPVPFYPTLVTGHDPEEWPKFKKAPDFYA